LDFDFLPDFLCALCGLCGFRCFWSWLRDAVVKVLLVRSRAIPAMTAIPSCSLACPERALRLEWVSYVVKVSGFPITRCTDHRITPISCDPLPVSFSHRPTPHKRFVENKSQSAIRLDSRLSGRSLFSRFSGLQSGSISALFSRFCCPVGRGSQRAGASVLADG
jgi:hypothetical protein